MLRLTMGPLYYEFSRFHDPRIRIAAGDMVQVESEDAFSGQIRSNQDRRDKSKVPFSNPLTGPIAVEGAQPGDTLAVQILDIQPLSGQCATRTSDPGLLSQWLGTDCPHGTHVCRIADGVIHWSDQLTIPYQPMLGCIGVAPHHGCPTTNPAGPHGGNMDIREVCPGSTILLPVFVPGAHLYLGDAHAAMGHGELSASGLEMAAVTTLKVEVIPGKELRWPRMMREEEIGVVVSGSPMERSIAQAYAELILWLESDHGWSRWRAYDLLTHVGEISIGYYGIGTVAAKVATRYLNPPAS